MIKELNTMSHFIKYDLMDELTKAIEMTDLESLGQELLNEESGIVEDCSVVDIIGQYISILNFIENETSIPTPVPDDVYDRIVEKFKDLGGKREIGVTSQQTSSKKFGTHKFPELRGSLDKIHFLTDEEIPPKDSRKSFQHFLNGVIREVEKVGINQKDINILVDYKWDGTSHVLEFGENVSLERVLTRYDVDNNVGVDITHIFKGADISKVLFCDLPRNISKSKGFGLKVETFMPTEYFNKYVEDMKDTKCNRRSAITSIVNRGEDEWEPSLLSYLALKPLQISSLNKIDMEDGENWLYVGMLNGRHQYIHIYTMDLAFKVKSLVDLRDNMKSYPVEDAIYAIQQSAADIVPIDGVVITIADQDIIDIMGRRDNKNKFQIAYKFPQGVKKTKLKEVRFPVGAVAGTITPLAIVEPVVINGNTITNATLSNFDKLERLDLNIGDEVIIKYDIIPKLEKDDSCKKGTGEKIVRITNCPVCGSDLKGGNRCLNPNCEAKLAGTICNYIKKLKIKCIGKETVCKLIDNGFLKSVADLYKLPRFMVHIMAIPGFGKSSVSNMITAIYARTNLYPHELLGAIGIPDVSTKTMQKVCEAMDDILFITESNKDEIISRMTEISGIGQVTAEKIAKGILEKTEVLDEIVPYISFLEYSKEKKEPTDVVLFTECRDSEFAEFLESVNVEVASSYVKRLTKLIVPDDLDIKTSPNRKVTRARDEGCEIMKLSEAKANYGYNK